MNSLDLISGLIIGGYLVTVVSRGGTADLIKLAQRDKGFIKWAIALAVLFYIRQFQDTTGIVDGLISAGIFAFLIYNVGAIQQNAQEIWASF